MAIDLSSFRRALDSFDRGLARAEASPGDDELRDGAIQRFECSYELAWKSLKRVLEVEAAKVFAAALRFAPTARRLLERLEGRVQ